MLQAIVMLWLVKNKYFIMKMHMIKPKQLHGSKLSLEPQPPWGSKSGNCAKICHIWERIIHKMRKVLL